MTSPGGPLFARLSMHVAVINVELLMLGANERHSQAEQRRATRSGHGDATVGVAGLARQVRRNAHLCEVVVTDIRQPHMIDTEA